ncbi:hypothetical protein B5F07_21715 [Lachnoclostridium sp. An169]|nr:hypothetical protein B5F07_21715 [Lachnoclostridium sp. An169]HJA66830.1 hypothetical protein [Candidatus Mediterraneibacter cottocaccae]
MLTVIGEPRFVAPGPLISNGTGFEGHAFYEASSMRKINEIYYFVYFSELSHELCYAKGKRPLGPFEYGGTLISIGDIDRQINLQKCCRQGCAEAVEKDVWKYEQIQKKSRLSVYSFLPRRTGKIMRGKPL